MHEADVHAAAFWTAAAISVVTRWNPRGRDFEANLRLVPAHAVARGLTRALGRSRPDCADIPGGRSTAVGESCARFATSVKSAIGSMPDAFADSTRL